MAMQQSPLRYSGRPSLDTRSDSTSLADLLERILDKGIVIAGDISISLVDIELLTIKLRLLITSVDKAREIGVNWWESDPWLSGRQQEQLEESTTKERDGRRQRRQAQPRGQGSRGAPRAHRGGTAPAGRGPRRGAGRVTVAPGPDGARVVPDALIRRLAPDLLTQVIEESRRDAAASVRARLTAALVEEMWQALGEGGGEGPTLESGRVAPAQTRRGAPTPGKNAEPSGADPGARGRDGASGVHGWYVVRSCTWSGAMPDLEADRGVDDAPLECITEGRLAAVVSRIRNSRQWGVDDRGELDMEALAPKARAHERVLERLLDGGAVLPLRFGVMYTDDNQLRGLLRSRSTTIESELTRLAGHSEWGLTVDLIPAAGLAPVHDIHTVGGGRDYLDRRRSERDAAERRAEQEGLVRESIHESLLSVAADGVILSRRRGSSGADERCVMRASYLVDSDRVDVFRATAESVLVGASAEWSLSGELTGPWPAYHFTDLRLDGEGVPA